MNSRTATAPLEHWPGAATRARRRVVMPHHLQLRGSVSARHPSDACRHGGEECASGPEIVRSDLTLAIIAINGWNRLAVSFRKPAGTYQPGALRK